MKKTVIRFLKKNQETISLMTTILNKNKKNIFSNRRAQESTINYLTSREALILTLFYLILHFIARTRNLSKGLVAKTSVMSKCLRLIDETVTKIIANTIIAINKAKIQVFKM